MVDLASPAQLSAVAATVAAVLAGANLVVSGRREHHRWVREALVDSYLVFTNISYEVSRLTRQTVDARRGAAFADLDEAKHAFEEVHARQVELLTRLRLLATPKVTTAAQALHDRGHDLANTAFAEIAPTDQEWEAARLRSHLARENWITIARRSIELRRGYMELARTQTHSSAPTADERPARREPI